MKPILLESGPWRAEAFPELGGNLCRLVYRGHDLLRAPPDAETLAAMPSVYGTPVLFPPNRIANGRFTFNGRACRLPLNDPKSDNHLHGLALRAAWTVTARAADRLDMAWRFGPDAPEYGGYPFACELRLSYRLRSDRVTQRLTVINRGGETMPCGIGLHTAFATPRRMRLGATGEYWELSPESFLPTGRRRPWADFDPNRWFDPAATFLSTLFPAAPGMHAAELDYGDVRVAYEVDRRYRHWCLWNQTPDSGFVCPEPMSWMTNAPNIDLPPEVTGFAGLAAGRRRSYVSRIRIVP